MNKPIWEDPDLILRFNSKFLRRNQDQCWEWTGGNVRGRGQFSVYGKWMLAPRIALVLACRAWPQDGRLACHDCDNPSCVNPDHLWWGTPSDNVQDAITKGRYPATRPKRKTKDICRNGHPLVASNIVGKRRECKICRHASKMRWQKASRSASRSQI